MFRTSLPLASRIIPRTGRVMAFRRPLHVTPTFLNSQQNKDVVSRIKMQPLERSNEDRKTKIARLTYQSRKRGILETDLLLSRFAKCYLNEMSNEELTEYDQLLDELDWDIYYWATKNFDVTPLPDKWKNSKVLEKLQEYSANPDKEIIRMPDL